MMGLRPGRWVLLAALLALAGCVVNPVTGQREIALVSTSQEIAIGQEQYVPAQQMQGSSYTTDPGLSAYVNGIGQKLAVASGVEPEIVGKPNTAMFEIAMHRLGVTKHETLMVGDRYETDIAGAVKLGLQTAGVLTGITTAEEFAQADPPPDLVTADLPSLLELMRAADQ